MEPFDALILDGRTIRIREFGPNDSLEEITTLLHEAYAKLAQLGFRYFATYQSPEQTKSRIDGQICLIGLVEERIIATVCYRSPANTKGTPWYDRPEVASFGQFGVHPAFQRNGLGGKLLEILEQIALRVGVEDLALDTAEGADHLIQFYERRGF